MTLHFWYDSFLDLLGRAKSETKEALIETNSTEPSTTIKTKLWYKTAITEMAETYKILDRKSLAHYFSKIGIQSYPHCSGVVMLPASNHKK